MYLSSRHFGEDHYRDILSHQVTKKAETTMNKDKRHIQDWLQNTVSVLVSMNYNFIN